MAAKDDRFTAREMAYDASKPRRLLGNAKVTLWDIDREELTPRERGRLGTIIEKIGELEDIIEDRELEELR